MRYAEELHRSMRWLASNPRVVILGQSVQYPGTAMTNTLAGIGAGSLLEMPVAEEMQMGISIGLSLAGLIPVSLYPRWNFLLLATNQLVNHLDKLPYSGYRPHVIIRTSIGSVRPLHPQWQHVGDFTEAFKLLCPGIDIIRLEEPEDVFPAYQWAHNSSKSTILVEYGDYHNEK